MSASTTETPLATALKDSQPAVDYQSANFEIDPSINDEERRFYLKAYPTIDIIIHRKVHCTVCRVHIGTAPNAEANIKMHPVLRVTHCIRCHDFYNSGEFSKGEDGSELYCRWCGQGGEVYCCSSCPYVFCKSCIVKNLSRGVVADIEQNENWSCFNCAPKILWPLRAQHWALVNYIETQKKSINSMNLPDTELRIQMTKDTSQCCRLAKSKANSMSDSLESLESNVSKRSHASAGSAKKSHKSSAPGPPPKRTKNSNDEVVCTPDLFSMLEPDCQITMASKTQHQSLASTPKIKSVQPNYSSPQNQQPLRSSVPPPLVLANTTIKVRQGTQSPVVRRTLVGLRPSGSSVQANTAPVYHTINGFRIDLNSASQQETFRLPNGKLIQVKRQGPVAPTPTTLGTGNSLIIRPRTSMQPAGQRPVPPLSQNNYGHSSNLSMQHNFGTVQNSQINRINNGVGTPGLMSTGSVSIQPINGAPIAQQTSRPPMIRHVFPNTPIGMARTQLQDQIFNAMEICTHLTSKVQTLTNSNAYKQARNYLEVKELYIHLSYLVTYAIGRFKGLQDKCLADMRQLGFSNDADSLENGQIAAAVDYVCESQLTDVDFFNTSSNSFHNQVYEYRKRIHEKLEDSKPLPPLFVLGVRADGDPKDEDDDELDEDDNDTNNWHKEDLDDNDNDEQDDQESYFENDATENDIEGDDYGYNGFESNLDSSQVAGTEESMTRNEQAHAYDRKLTRLIREYPSIWCTRHADYGNFEVTRKQWRVIASHFKRGDNIKLRWKNIRKRYVRIERRISQGKRFHGYFDKATNYLSNRDLPENEWNDVDCGDDDGDVYERKELDVIEDTLHNKRSEELDTQADANEVDTTIETPTSVRPLDLRPIDARIIDFAKSHPVLWRKSSDPQFNSIDEQTRKSLWLNFWKTVSNYRCEYIVERWQQMYEMYKSFRLKVIKDKQTFANLELKYSKYLAKLYFLYKIDEDDLREEREQILDCDSSEARAKENEPRMLDMPDDKQFIQCLVQTLRSYPTLWNSRHFNYNDAIARDRLWSEIAYKMQHFKRDGNAIRKRWQLAKFAYECYNRELRRQPAPNEDVLRKLRKNLPIEDMWFMDT